MSRIRSKNTKPELLVRQFLHSKGLRFKLHEPSLPGKPDLVFPKYRTVININGCFWHLHSGCKFSVMPKTKTEYWENKLLKNKARDVKNTELLEMSGWKVIVVWECELKKDKLEETLNSLYSSITS